MNVRIVTVLFSLLAPLALPAQAEYLFDRMQASNEGPVVDVEASGSPPVLGATALDVAALDESQSRARDNAREPDPAP